MYQIENRLRNRRNNVSPRDPRVPWRLQWRPLIHFIYNPPTPHPTFFIPPLPYLFIQPPFFNRSFSLLHLFPPSLLQTVTLSPLFCFFSKSCFSQYFYVPSFAIFHLPSFTLGHSPLFCTCSHLPFCSRLLSLLFIFSSLFSLKHLFFFPYSFNPPPLQSVTLTSFSLIFFSLFPLQFISSHFSVYHLV